MERKLEILILEDSADDAKLIERALRSGGQEFRAQRVETRDDFLRALTEQQPDAILADCKLPQFDGRTALKLAAEHRPQVPVIIVTGTITDEVAVELLHEGAQDYVLKDRLSRLASAVRRAIERVRVLEEKRRDERELRQQLDELRRFQRLTVDRELRMQELESENARLRAQAGK